jgi:hypothetical protein
MLLSFERPVPAGSAIASIRRPSALSAALENCTVATVTVTISTVTRVSPTGLFELGQITVKIVRAHGGCLGT